MPEQEWTLVEAPTTSSLYDVVVDGGEAYATGSDGLVLAYEGGGWEPIVEEGPRNEGNSLYGVDVTADGERVWFVGSSGTVGEYDVVADELHEHQVGDFRNSHNDVAVTGHGGAANVYVVDASGYVHYSLANGEEGTWRHVRPGTGAELTGIDFCGERRGFAADDDGAVYATEDGEKWDASLVGTDVTLYSTVCRQPGETRPERQEEDEEGEDATDVESEPEVVETEVEDVWVSGDGKVCHYDGVQWRVDDHGSSSINDVDCDRTETLGVAGGGRVFDLEESGELTEEETPTGETLNGVAVGEFDVAVGASGVVIQKEN